MFERPSRQKGPKKIWNYRILSKKMDPQKEILRALLYPSPPLDGKSMINKVGSVLLNDEYVVNVKKEPVQIIFCH